MTTLPGGQAFSDSNIEWLKALLLKGHLYSDLVSDNVLLALLARLEASELVGATAHAYIHSPSEITKENYYKADEAWRKSKGEL